MKSAIELVLRKGSRTMQAFQGDFDAENIKPLEHISAKPNQKVIITVMDEFVKPRKAVSAEDLYGRILNTSCFPHIPSPKQCAPIHAQYSKVIYYRQALIVKLVIIQAVEQTATGRESHRLHPNHARFARRCRQDPAADCGLPRHLPDDVRPL